MICGAKPPSSNKQPGRSLKCRPGNQLLSLAPGGGDWAGSPSCSLGLFKSASDGCPFQRGMTLSSTCVSHHYTNILTAPRVAAAFMARANPCQSFWMFPSETNHEPVILLLGISTREMNPHDYQKPRTRRIRAALFIIAPNQKHTQCPATVERMNKPRYSPRNKP